MEYDANFLFTVFQYIMILQKKTSQQCIKIRRNHTSLSSSSRKLLLASSSIISSVIPINGYNPLYKLICKFIMRSIYIKSYSIDRNCSISQYIHFIISPCHLHSFVHMYIFINNYLFLHIIY